MKTTLVAIAALALATLVSTSVTALATDFFGPAKVTTLHVDKIGYHSFTVEWTNTSANCDANKSARGYELRSSGSAITDYNWQSAAIADSGAAGAHGTETCYVETVSCPHANIYYAVFLIDAGGNRSPISNVLSAQACHPGYGEVDCDY